ncbi:MAG: MotA/TolQ/ExbB proton channel family protein [Bdellovibrionales bacterium]|nr:MotA/TolQ/ExbB proton channel family protein [Bdellovibrionales bacterium]
MLTDKFFIIAKVGHESTLWILIILSILSVAFIIERYMALSQALRKSDLMKKEISDTLKNNSIKDIDELSRDKESIEGRALSYGLRHVKEHGANGLEEIFNAYAQVERPDLEKRLNFLATVGSNAPFIGLLGTVFGIMDAFRSLAEQSEIQTVLLGISQALIATATGLLVAIPAVIFYNFFQKRVKRIMQNLDGTKELCVAYAKTYKGQS